ncbi:MAG TPA: YkvA family protein [Gammaproteobacteria bacterium]|nr:YkvA family protein [Gammaproteobacteria bacterium]
MALEEQPAPPGFPREEFAALVRRLPKYGRLAWALARDPRLSRVRRVALAAAAAYVFSPIDLVPGIIPVAGQLDDLAIALAAIRLALDGLRPDVRAERLAAAGLTESELNDDVHTLGAIAGWAVRSGVRVGRQLASNAIDVGSRFADRLIGAGRALQRRRRQPGWPRQPR